MGLLHTLETIASIVAKWVRQDEHPNTRVAERYSRCDHPMAVELQIVV